MLWVRLKELRFGRDKISRRETHLMNRTLHRALESECHQQHGAMVVKSGRILGLATNKMNNDPSKFCDDLFNKHRNLISTHAEVAAMKGISPEVAKGSTVFVGRVLKDGTPGLSKPCPNCEAFLVSMGVRKVIYT